MNTFLPSVVSVKLTETGAVLDGTTQAQTFKLIPGTTLAKDATVEVTADISCYVYVEVNASANLADYITWELAEGWTELTANPGVYYREFDPETSVTPTFPVVKDNTVTVNKTVTKALMDALYNADGTVNTAALPTLTFKAYACQKEGFADAAEAWKEINPPTP